VIKDGGIVARPDFDPRRIGVEPLLAIFCFSITCVFVAYFNKRRRSPVGSPALTYAPAGPVWRTRRVPPRGYRPKPKATRQLFLAPAAAHTGRIVTSFV
jgi:hypothetical protein